MEIAVSTHRWNVDLIFINIISEAKCPKWFRCSRRSALSVGRTTQMTRVLAGCQGDGEGVTSDAIYTQRLPKPGRRPEKAELEKPSAGPSYGRPRLRRKRVSERGPAGRSLSSPTRRNSPMKTIVEQLVFV